MAAGGPDQAEAGGGDALVEITWLLERTVRDLETKDGGKVMEMDAVKLSVDKDPAQQRLIFYRAVRAQTFLARQDEIISKHDAWVKQEFRKLKPKRKVIDAAQRDAFYQRLVEDGKNRSSTRETAIAEKLAKEQAILASSALFAKGKRRR